MNENKPVTAEEIGRKAVDEYLNGKPMFQILEEYATLKTQQLTAENERLNAELNKAYGLPSDHRN